ncbi:MAG: four-carbon acid sugar kinase family protein [Christensenellales bacterium]
MEKLITLESALNQLPPVRRLDDFYAQDFPLYQKLVVLDDDPTGTQTVNGVYVYTVWDEESLTAALSEKGHIFFILTNSRGLSAADSRAQHQEIIRNLTAASKRTGVPFMVISRSDSTLRGHYPMETEVLRAGLEEIGTKIDGEIIAPFFLEGGRYTIGDVHYVKEGDVLVPAGQTEFAKDTTFGYRSSDLKDWVREKNPDMPFGEAIHSVSIHMLRTAQIEEITGVLKRAGNFEKIIVNAACYEDMEVFVQALYGAIAAGKNYLFRTAAGFVRVFAKIAMRPLLTGAELTTGSELGGLVIVGSHVKKTTQQLEGLLELEKAVPIEFDVNVLDESDEAVDESIDDAVENIRRAIVDKKTAVVYTSRKVVRKTEENSEANLRFSVRVSESLVQMVRRLPQMPSFIVAKGGITSSDIGVKGLGAKKALVLGQVLPGVPVWQLGPESKYPGVSYVVFPGNVGDENGLRDVVYSAQKG